MKHEYKIYQLDPHKGNVKRDHKMYESWEMLNRTASFSMWEYNLVWEDEIETDENETSDEKILDMLFEQFNIAHPKNYYGRSMSTSDVVVLDGVKYYCDSIGWKKI
jgi:hypothetical protein